MDISDTIVPRSDQLNGDDLLAGPRTVTVEKVTKGSAEQPVDVHLTEYPGRPFRPSKTVRRILVAAWGPDAAAYVGRRMTLYRDPAVRFGGAEVGGIRVSHLSHLDRPLSIALTVTRGKKALTTVQPLPNDAPTVERVDRDQLARIGALMTDLGIDDRPAFVAEVIGHPVAAKELTRDEASLLIEHMARALGEVTEDET